MQLTIIRRVELTASARALGITTEATPELGATRLHSNTYMDSDITRSKIISTRAEDDENA